MQQKNTKKLTDWLAVRVHERLSCLSAHARLRPRAHEPPQVKKAVYTQVDGAAPANKDLRARLWEVAGVRGYPLVFKVDGAEVSAASSFTFVGDFDAVSEIVESESWDASFGDCAKTL